MTHRWWYKRMLGERRDQLCKVNARGANGSIEVEFEDGFKCITTRFAIRRIK